MTDLLARYIATFIVLYLRPWSGRVSLALVWGAGAFNLYDGHVPFAVLLMAMPFLSNLLAMHFLTDEEDDQ